MSADVNSSPETIADSPPASISETAFDAAWTALANQPGALVVSAAGLKAALEAGLAIELARIAQLETLARHMLATYQRVSDGYRGRVGQVQIAKWQTELTSPPAQPPSQPRGVRYWVLVNEEVMTGNPRWPDGLRPVAKDNAGPADLPGMCWWLFEDDGAPAEFAGKHVELTVTEEHLGKLVITERRLA